MTTSADTKPPAPGTKVHEIISCILAPECTYESVIPEPAEVDPEDDWAAKALGRDLGALVAAKDRANAAKVERDLKRHLKGHTTEEWVKALAAAKAQITAFTKAIASHQWAQVDPEIRAQVEAAIGEKS